jgi:putative endonuclease
MTQRSEDGAAAEAMAAAYLVAQGLAIVRRNVRTRFGELDIIARDGDALVFVEVRLRKLKAFGGAAASITPAKQGRMIASARIYLAALRHEPACRFDVVLLDGLDPRRIEWLRNVIEVA